MTINIILTFDNYAEFVRSLTPEAIDELMKDKEPVIPSAYEWLNAARIEGGKLPAPTVVPAPTVPEPTVPAPVVPAPVVPAPVVPAPTVKMNSEPIAKL